MGRSFKATPEHRKMVAAAYAMGMKQDDICQLIRSTNDKPVDTKTLRKYFGLELHKGRAQLEYKLRGTAAQVACDTNHPKFATMNIWMQKTLLGINETNIHRMEGPDGEPLASGTPSWVVVVHDK